MHKESFIDRRDLELETLIAVSSIGGVWLWLLVAAGLFGLVLIAVTIPFARAEARSLRERFAARRAKFAAP